MRYLSQAAYGQLSLRAHARPIDVVIRDRRTPVRTRALLAEVPAIKRFGERNGLRPTDNYDSYVELGRPAVVWVVRASRPFAFQSRTWRLPIVGRVPYLGWFDRRAAQAFAAGLAREGWDVDVSGAQAYSTLGWFRDPILSSMIEDGDDALGSLVSTILHESLHATVFLKGQTHFNESVASFVGDRLAGEYLVATRTADAPETIAYLRSLEWEDTVGRAFRDARAQLELLYASRLPFARKLAEKAHILRDLRRRTGYRRPINNATLMDYKAYHSGRAELDELYDTCARDWRCFVAAIRSVKGRDFARADQEELEPVLGALVARVRRERAQAQLEAVRPRAMVIGAADHPTPR